MSTAGIVILIIVVVVALAVAGWLTARRRTLRAKFGPEYDRVAPQAGEPLGVEPPATVPAADRAINNTVPLSIPGHEPWRIS